MKKITGLIILAALAVMLSGCVINVGEQDYIFRNDCWATTVHVTDISDAASGEDTNFYLSPGAKKIIRIRSSSFSVYYDNMSNIDIDIEKWGQVVKFFDRSIFD